MKANNIFLKNVLMYIQMYFIGPLIWGGWMVYKLKILTLQEYGHCVLSPVMMIIFSFYFVSNLFYIKSLLSKISDSPATMNKKASIISYSAALKVHCVSLLSFGTIGTSICMSLLSTNHFSFIEISLNDWLLKAVIGSLSGASLVFLFYILFSAMIFTNMAGLAKETYPYGVRKTLISLKYFNLVVYISGLILFIGTATVSFIIGYINCRSEFYTKEAVIFGFAIAFPNFMSGLLYFKSVKRIGSCIKSLDDNSIKKEMDLEKPKLFKLKYVVQVLLLSAFFILLLSGKIKVWLFILIIGFCTSLLIGRVYCGWCCPVNTMNRFINMLYKRLRIKKRPVPLFLQDRLISTIFFTLLLSVFIFSLWYGKRFQLFVILTFAGVLVSIIFASSFWCNYLCPWGALFKITNKCYKFKGFMDKRQNH